MTPLSMEKLSLGSPKMFQACILIGSPKVLLKENSCEHGIFFSCKEVNIITILSFLKKLKINISV